MKIESAIQHITSVQAKNVKSKQGKSGSPADGLVSDNVEITGTSSRMRQLETQLAELSSEDAGKVESIRQAIADGSFTVDEEVVAENMIQETIEQLSHRNTR